MAQSGFTPISIYYSATASTVPLAANLVAGELALNTNDGKLYYKNSSNVVTLLAGATAGPAGGSNTQVQFNSSGALAGSANLTFDGTTLTAAGLAGPLGVATPATGSFTSLTYSTTLTGGTGIVNLGSGQFYKDASGNVGIGTSSPAATLNVYNATSAAVQVDGDGAAAVRVTRYSTNTTGSTSVVRKARGTLASPTAVATGDESGGFYMQSYGGTNFRNVARIDGLVQTYTSDTNIAGAMRFYTNNSSTDVTEWMRIDSTGNLLIGTTTSPAGSKELVLGGDYIEGVVAIGNSSTSKTISLANGTFQTVTMTGNCTFTMPTAIAGKSFILIVSTGAGGFTGVFTSVKWPNNTAPTLTTTATRWDILTFASDGTNWYGNFAQAYQ